MAAPVAAGIAALVKSNEPAITPEQLVDRLDDTGIAWECFLGSRGYAIDTSRVDAFCALTNNQACGADPSACQSSP